MYPNLKIIMKRNTNKLNLVLSGGSARGIAHIGVLEELLSRGYQIESIAGTSMGAMVAGAFTVNKLQEFKERLLNLDRREAITLMDFSIKGSGFIKGEKLRKTLLEIIPDINIEDLPIPYAAVAVDLNTKSEVVFTSGNLYDAIRASISIPTVFKPVRRDKQILVDGGVLNNLPIAHVKRTKNAILTAVSVNAMIKADYPPHTPTQREERQKAYQQKLKNFYDTLPKLNKTEKKEKEERISSMEVINQVIGIMTYQATQQNLELFPPDLFIEVSRDVAGLFDYFKADSIIEYGRYTAQKKLDTFEKERAKKKRFFFFR